MRRGRKRKLDVQRTPSGRRSEALSAQREHIEPIAVRSRMFKLSEEEARDQKAATVVGRLHLLWRRSGDRAGGLTERQYDAAVEYKSQADAYRRALSAPDSLRNASRTGTGTRTDEEHAKWCRAVIAKFEASQRAVADEQRLMVNRGANLFAALDYTVLRDQQFNHLLGDARVALNALAHHYGLA